ncbi:PIG-L deacetylase family protein [Halalkalibaculum sp. DA3122]|uniref:PIG-L deacetylase family protein n=1 Tax=unclassified Halalkalibaculum TaxID=2964617 RepID=UPI003754DAA8
MTDITGLNKVLVLAPHTDDAELGCGGTIVRMLDNGVEVHVAVFSTARASLPPGSDPDLLRKEFNAAMDILNIPGERRYVYDYQVRKLNYSRQEVLEELVKLKRKIEPEMVLLPSGSDLHQDHQVVNKEGLRAFKEITVWGYELPWNHITFSAQAFVTLTKEQIDKKWEILTVYESQVKKNRNYFTEEFIRGLAKVRGVQVKADYAEAFEVIRVKW